MPDGLVARTPQMVDLWDKHGGSHRNYLVEANAHYQEALRQFDGFGIAPEAAVASMHVKVDKFVRDAKRIGNGRKVSCKSGCSACCYIGVRATRQEAQVLAKRINDGLSVDVARLRAQDAAGEFAEDYAALPREVRKCVFLADGKCRVYDVRPMACRKYMVRSDPALCDTEKSPGGRVAIVVAWEAEVFYNAALGVLDTNPLSRALLQEGVGK